MDPLLTGVLSFLFLMVIIALGTPIWAALTLTGFLGICYINGIPIGLNIIGTTPHSSVGSYALSVVALFYLMGTVAEQAGIAGDAYDVAHKWLARLPGGLAMTTTVACGFFAAICGSSVANAAVFSKIALPQMVKFGYSRQLALGSVASAGTFAVMIPPSILMVIYGLMTNLSIGKLLIAGLFPGLFTILVYLISIYIRCKWISPSIAPAINLRFTWRERFSSTKKVVPIMIIFIVVLGGIYAGWFTPTAGAAVGAFTTFIVAFAMKKGLKKKEIAEIATTSALGITSVMMILVGGFLFSQYLTRSGFVDTLSGWVMAFDFSSVAIIVVICIMYLVLGCFMDAIPMMLITVSFVFPLITKMGFDGIWFGVILVKLCEIGAITPPIGINLFVVAAAVGDKDALSDVIKGVIPFVGLEMIILIILILVPQISLFLPQHMTF